MAGSDEVAASAFPYGEGGPRSGSDEVAARYLSVMEKLIPLYLGAPLSLS